jgi:signal transduction histidine kinase
MTSAIVHDLKNPLSAVMGFTELALVAAKEGSPPHEIAEELTGAVQGCLRLRDMLQELLEFAREGSSQLQTLPTLVADLLEQMLSPLAPILARDCVHLDLDVERARGFRCDLDRGRFQRVLENLLSNAREALLAQASGGGRGESTIAVQARVDGGRLGLRIADNGPGIPPELRTRLFEPFATARKEQGTGLGLATARNIIRAHGGDIEVESDPPEGGAAFHIHLPPSRATAPGQPAAQNGAVEPPTPAPTSPPLGVAPVVGGTHAAAR